MRGDTAIQISAEVAHNEKWYRTTVHLPAGEKGGQMFCDRMAQRTFPCAVRPVCARTHAASITRMAPTQQPVSRIGTAHKPVSGSQETACYLPTAAAGPAAPALPPWASTEQTGRYSPVR
jgi:hypothetical protein